MNMHLQEELDKEREKMLEFEERRSEHIRRGLDMMCEYYFHQTRMWEYHRGRVNLIMEFMKRGHR